MERKEVKQFQRHGSAFVGAILMSNRATKVECLQRKLFGLPSSMAWFVMEIKAGMLLFLFEHEERKLYGVFEAICDGAMNIVPNAFTSSGNSFPAQVLFKRIWMCKPLCEDKFRDAIEENYFAPHKFKFGLSHDQVFKLVELFALTRINVKQYQRPGIPNEIIREFEKCDGNNARVTRRGESKEVDLDEYNRDDGIGSRMYLDLSGSNTNSSISHQKVTRKQPSFVNNGHRLYQMALRATETRPPNLLRDEQKPPFLKASTSANDPSISENFSECPVYSHLGFRGSGSKISSQTGGDSSSLPQKPINHIESSMDTESDHSGSQWHASHIGPNSVKFRPPNLMGSSFPICNPSNISLPPIHSEGHLKFHGYKHVSHTECYDPSKSRSLFSRGIPPAEGIETLPSVQLSNSHGYLKASRHQVESGGQACGGLGPPPDFIRLPGTNSFDKNMEPSHSNSSPKDASLTNSSECMEENASHAEVDYYPTVVKSRFHADTEQRRTSVFSRLTRGSYTGHLSKASEARRSSKIPEASHFSKSPVTFQKYETQEPVTNPLLDQLARILSERRELETTKAPKWSSIPDDDEKFQSAVANEVSNVTYPWELEARNDAIAEESSEHLFLNFKRKCEIWRLSGENELNVCADSGLGEGTPQKSKRRKLPRPFFIDEECQDVEASTQEIVGVKSVERHENIVNGELSPTNHLDTDSKNSSASETSLHSVASDENSGGSRNIQLDAKSESSSAPIVAGLGTGASDKTENSSESLKTCRKEVTNRNLRWFLQKFVDGHAKVVNVDHVNEKIKDESSHAVV